MGERIPTLDEARSAFLDDLLLAGRSPRTRATYAERLRPLAGDLDAFTPAAVRHILAEHVAAGHAASTLRLTFAALSSFGAYCVDQGWLMVSPTHRMKPPKAADPDVHWLTPEQVRAVYAACDTDENRLIVRLLLTGLRASELLGLRYSDIDRTEGTVAVLGKGRKRRTLPLDEDTLALIFETRGKNLVNLGAARAAIIPCRYSALSQRLERLGRRAALPWRLTAHTFRRSMATAWLADTGDMGTLIELGGWADAGMARRYAKAAVSQAAMKRAREVGLTRALD